MRYFIPTEGEPHTPAPGGLARPQHCAGNHFEGDRAPRGATEPPRARGRCGGAPPQPGPGEISFSGGGKSAYT